MMAVGAEQRVGGQLSADQCVFVLPAAAGITSAQVFSPSHVCCLHASTRSSCDIEHT